MHKRLLNKIKCGEFTGNFYDEINQNDLLSWSNCLFNCLCWHFDNGAAVPAELKTMALESGDPYSEMSMAMRKQLLSNNVNLVPAKQGVPVLRLNKQTSSDKVASVFKQGREAEKY